VRRLRWAVIEANAAIRAHARSNSPGWTTRSLAAHAELLDAYGTAVRALRDAEDGQPLAA
jgi:hypothetical protein